MRHRLDCPNCLERYPSKLMMSAFLHWRLVCPSCSAPLKFTTGSSVLMMLLGLPMVPLEVVLMLYLWHYLSWASLVLLFFTNHFLGSALWITCGELELDRKRQAKPHSA